MNGFIHALYLEKWCIYGWRIHYLHAMLYLTLLTSMTSQAFTLKEHPDLLDNVSE